MKPETTSRRRWLAMALSLPLLEGVPMLHVGQARAATTTALAGLQALQLVVPAPPGSQPDLLARWLVGPLAQRAGVEGTVLNLPGAAGAIAADAVLGASAERGALLLGGLDHVAYSHQASGRRALDPFVDFWPVATANLDHWVVATAADGPAASLPALIAASRQRPLNHGSTGEGSTAHLLAARLCRATGLDAQHVPYKDPWMPDLIAGRLDFVVAPTPAVMGALRGGRLKLLASLSEARLPLPGEPPSIAELGWPDQAFRGGLFLFAPASLAPMAQALNGWLREIVADPAMGQRFREAAIDTAPLDLDQTADLLRQRWRTVEAMRLAVFGRGRT